MILDIIHKSSYVVVYRENLTLFLNKILLHLVLGISCERMLESVLSNIWLILFTGSRRWTNTE